jgi:hypothetical protein
LKAIKTKSLNTANPMTGAINLVPENCWKVTPEHEN